MRNFTISITLLAFAIALPLVAGESRLHGKRESSIRPQGNSQKGPAPIRLVSYYQEALGTELSPPVPSTGPPPSLPPTEPVPPTEPLPPSTPPATIPPAPSLPPARVDVPPPAPPQPDRTVIPETVTPAVTPPPETYAPAAPPAEPASPPNPTAIDWCAPPANLSIPEPEFLAALGYSPNHCFVYSQRNCFELALQCYRLGKYADAVAVADHGLRHGHYSPLYLIRGASQIAAGDCAGAQDASRAIFASRDYLNSRTYDNALERISGPDVVRVRELIQLYEGR
ncbi:MAG: hypothetical protein AB7O26_17875 [Planctomycetaceae bacterium]